MKPVKILPNLFFLFLSAPIFSPYVGGFTIYLYAICAIIDIHFFKWIIHNISPESLIGTMLFFFLILIVGLQLMFFLKLIMLAITILYFIYCYQSGFFYLYRYAVLSIFVGIIQFILFFTSPQLAKLIGPDYVTVWLWGDYATPAFTNYFTIYILPRVSGLCREGGFFASYVSVTFVCLLYDTNFKKYKKWIFFILLIGFTISISKSSIAILFAPLIFLFRYFFNRFNLMFMAFIVPILLSFIFSTLLNNTSVLLDESLLHRFGGYALVQYTRIEDYIIGTNIPSLLSRMPNSFTMFSYGNFDQFSNFCGLPAIYLTCNIFTYILFVLYLKKIKMTTFGFLLIILFTANVRPYTCDNFIIIIWFVGIFLMKNNYRPIKNKKVNIVLS
jgi:hypothetical protein